MQHVSRSIAALLMVLVAANAAVGAQSVAPALPEPVPTWALVLEDAYGRVIRTVIRKQGRSWTSSFPRTGGPTDRDGLPLSGLEVQWRIEAEDLVVKVSLFYGGAHRRQHEVATVRLRENDRVTIDQLRTYGVQPISLAVETVPSTPMFMPATRSVSGQLHVEVEPVVPDVPRYRVSLTNTGSRAVTAVHFRALRDGRAVTSGRRAEPRNEPLIPAGARYDFPLSVETDRTEWQPYDRIEITGVLWDDGLVEGDQRVGAEERDLNAGKAQQIRRVLRILREAAGGSAADVEARLGQLPGEQIGERLVAEAALEDLHAFLARNEASGFGVWVDGMVAAYEAWYRRLPPGQ